MANELVSDMVRYTDRFHHNSPAILDGDTIVTYGEFADSCRRLAGALASLGVGPGDRVAALVANGPRSLELQFAVPSMGAILVLLNTRLAPAELREVLADADAKILLHDSSFADVAAQLSDTVPVVTDAGGLPVEMAEPFELGVGIDESDPAAIFYTGGTTGLPKGVVLSHRNITSMGHRCNSRIRFTKEDVYLHSLPAFHVADSGFSFAITWAGGAHTFVSRFDPGEVMEKIERHRVSYQVFFGTNLRMLLDHEDFARRDLSSLRLIGTGMVTEPLLMECFEAFPGCSFGQYFGMTEACSHVTGFEDVQKLAPGDPRFASTGKPVPGVEINVCRPDGSGCDPHEVGEITVAGATVMSGYWKKPELTAEVLRDGWYWTGDLGYLDEEANLFLAGRAKEMLKSGGENVYPAEVERALMTHPAVSEVAVFGVPDDKWAERVHAVVALRAGSSASEEELTEHCRGLIGGFKLPRSWEFQDALQKTGVGKIDKRAMLNAYTEREAVQTGA
jgi:long-chain acyl-CoA synthetase